MKSSIKLLALLAPLAALLVLSSCDKILGGSETPPSAPKGLQATAGDGSVRLGWAEVLEIDSYTVYWKEGDYVTKQSNDGMKATTDTVATVSGLVNGRTYSFMVTATKAGLTSVASSTVGAVPTSGTVLQRPLAPASLSATPADGRVSLSWSPSLWADSYSVYYKSNSQTASAADQKAPSTAISGTGATITGLMNLVPYAFVVTATNAAGEGASSSPVYATPRPLDLAAPSNPTLVNPVPGNAQIALSWTNPADTDFSFVKITWVPEGGNQSQPAIVAKPGTSRVLDGLVNGTAYSFTIKAVDTGGNESAGVTVSATPNTVDLSPAMVTVAGGTFSQGRQVTLSDFLIGKYEVTMEQFDAYCEDVGRSLVSDSGWGRGRRPAMNLSWYDAVAFCNWLSAEEGLQPAYSGGGTSWTMDRAKGGYRLPTEAEWEFAARGGTQSLNSSYAGGNALGDLAWHQGNSGAMSHEVGGKASNELGLYDMSGNVWEWCWDWYADYPTVAEMNPIGPATGSDKVGRGGCWADPDSSHFLPGTRWHIFGPPPQGNYLGFRLARSLPDTTPPANPGAFAAAAGQAQVTLSWTNPTDADFASAEISWTPAEGSPSQPCILAKPETSQIIAGLANGTTGRRFTASVLVENAAPF